MIKVSYILIAIVLFVLWAFSIVDYSKKSSEPTSYACNFIDGSTYYVHRFKIKDDYIIDMVNGGIFHKQLCVEFNLKDENNDDTKIN